MKLVAFEAKGRRSFGIVHGDGIIDAGARLHVEDLDALISAGALSRVDEWAASAPDLALKDIRVLKPIAHPGKILCVGINYPERSAEYKDGSEAPKYPSIFVRFPASLVAHDEAIVRPPESTLLDYEGEIAVIIGTRGRRIPEADVPAHILGYTIANEGTIRDWLRHGRFNVTPGKNFDATGSVGPWIVTPDEVTPGPMRIVTRVNAEIRQDDTSDRMVFPIPALVSYLSTFCTLEPGDMILTGTPAGAGARLDPPRYLVPGDVVEVDVSGIGTLRNTVRDEVDTDVVKERAASAGRAGGE
jgi:5-carboxymethyl-2-hydroxymuconate isomerase